ncbi:MAG: NAD(P)H-binding protein [Candidatus Eisenbacteria bacterium]|nr:NAD(P)H-binding protein [Candidatus Eisenbacteria bacterium]
MDVLLAGATGFTGSRVLDLLLENGHRVACLVRPWSDAEAIEKLDVAVVRGSLEEAPVLADALRGRDALVSAGPLTPATANGIVGAAGASCVARIVVIGTTSIFTNLNAASKTRKTEAESTIRDSGLDYTLLRPTMIYGTHEDRNMCRLVRYLSTHTFMPVFGSGKHLQQPVHVEDLARAVVLALENPVSIGKAYDVAGGEAVTYSEVIDTTARLLGRRVVRVHLPLGLSLALVRLYRKVAPNPQIHAEQVLRLNEDKAFSTEEIERDLGYDAVGFEEGMRREIEEIRSWDLARRSRT